MSVSPAHRRLRQDQRNRVLTDTCTQSFSFLHTNAPLYPAFHALAPSSPPIPSPLLIKQSGCCDVGEGKEQRKKHRRKGRKEGRCTTSTDGNKETIRNINHGLERHRWCKGDIYWRVTHAVNDMRVLLSMPPLWLLLLLLLVQSW